MTKTQLPKLFNREHPASIALLDSWEDLLINKGDRAELRRCKNLKKLQQTSTFQRHYWKLSKKFMQGDKYPQKEQMAIMIALVAYIDSNVTSYKEGDEEKPDYFAYQISRGDKPKLSELRFRRLLKIDDREKLFHFLIQVLRVLDKKVNILDLLSIAYFWGDNTKTKLAYKYYEKANLD
ncbi:MAG: type I-E CRISPR-associated protein Cse2/CasB [Methyloprofundus sp.]|nr:type I-E CRISPR-associated protein Cse2/CasB [Methyloprofundus sp.]